MELISRQREFIQKKFSKPINQRLPKGQKYSHCGASDQQYILIHFRRVWHHQSKIDTKSGNMIDTNQ